jgi:hypothetical protein
MHFYGGSTTVAPNNVLVEQNWIEGGGTGGVYTKGTGNTLINNVIYDNGRHPFQSQPKGITVSSTATGFTAYHNTIYANARCIDLNSTENVSIRNNICFANATNTITGAGSGSTTTPNFFRNPLFVAAPANLDLQSTSPARSGSAPVGVTTDYAGMTREAPADFGAFEFETVAPLSTTHDSKPNGHAAADGSRAANAWKGVPQ